MSAPLLTLENDDVDLDLSAETQELLRRSQERLDRLSLSTSSRVRGATLFAALLGGALGSSLGAQNAGYRFRAENSHRLPTTEKGWYFYHKTKNYVVMQGAGKEGLRMAVKLGGWTGLFFLVEAAVDKNRGKKDMFSSLCAGMSVAGAFSLWNRLPFATAARMIKLGIYAGVGYGFAQDGLALLHGQKVTYIEKLKNNYAKGKLETLSS